LNSGAIGEIGALDLESPFVGPIDLSRGYVETDAYRLREPSYEILDNRPIEIRPLNLARGFIGPIDLAVRRIYGDADCFRESGDDALPSRLARCTWVPELQYIRPFARSIAIPSAPAVARTARHEGRLHHAGEPLGEWLLRVLQRQAARLTAERRNLLHAAGSTSAHRVVARPLQHDPATQRAGLSTART